MSKKGNAITPKSQSLWVYCLLSKQIASMVKKTATAFKRRHA